MGSYVPLVLSRPYYMNERHCGYCQGQKKDHYALQSMVGNEDYNESATIGSSVEQMSCQQYDEFINQGFRRSGKFLYKNDLLRSCCRLYTIRTTFSSLKLDKKQRKVVNRFVKEIYKATQHDNKTFDLHQLLVAQQKSSSFRTRYEPSKFSKEKFQLYKKYQISVHNDKEHEISESSFRRFLCDTPFPASEVMGNADQWDYLNHWVENWKPGSKNVYPDEKVRRIGPVHECWYLHGKLIAISVLDFLPSGVSSIYFIWDPDYAHLSLGTLSGIREILMCNELDLGYYYLGYYIEDCQKMKYKGKFGGEILDLCNEVYFPLNIVKPYIAHGRFFVIDEQANITEEKTDKIIVDENEVDKFEENEFADDKFADDKIAEDKFKGSRVNGHRTKETYQEIAIENNGHPSSYLQSKYNKKPLRNVAEEIYGKGAVSYTVCQAIGQSIQLIAGNKELSTLPGVVPGINPLWQIVEWFDNGIIDMNMHISIFDCMKNELIECSFKEASSHHRRIIIDSIRVFGIDKTHEAIILV